MRRWMADREGFGVKGRKNIYTKGWRVKSGDNPVTSWCTSSRT